MFLGAARDVGSDQWDSILSCAGRKREHGVPVNLKARHSCSVSLSRGAFSWPFMSGSVTDRAVVSQSSANPMSAPQFVLSLSCPDRASMLPSVSTMLFEGGQNIPRRPAIQRCRDRPVLHACGVYGGRQRARDRGFAHAVRGCRDAICDDVPAARPLGAAASDALVSRFDHCLVDLIYRWRNGEPPIPDRGGRQSSARDLQPRRPRRNCSTIFRVTPATKFDQEIALAKLIDNTDRPRRARPAMQVLSDGLAARLVGRCITSTTRSFRGSRVRGYRSTPARHR